MNNEKKIEKCIFCGSDAVIEHYASNIYYVHCSNPDCIKVDRYSCLGSTAQNAIDQWKVLMRPINRTPSPRKKKNDEDNNL